MLITRDLSIRFQTLKSEEQLWIKGHFQTEDQGTKSHLHLASLLDTTKVSTATRTPIISITISMILIGVRKLAARAQACSLKIQFS